MANQTMSGSVPSIHKSLSTTNPDLVTISGVVAPFAKVTNRDAAQPLWAGTIASASASAIAAAADGVTFIGPGKSELVPLSYDNSGQAYLSLIGSGNAYSVSFGTRASRAV